jgi:hypothetical protein
VPLAKFLRQALGALSVGVDRSLLLPWWRIIPALFLFLIGLWYGWRASRKATILLLGYQLIPFGITLLLSIVNPIYNGVRHLLIGLPPFLLFVAEGISGPVRGLKQPNTTTTGRTIGWAAALLGILLLVVQLDWLRLQFTSPGLVRDDIRAAAEYIELYAAPDDIVVIHNTLVKFTVDYYYDGLAPAVAIPSLNEQKLDQAIEVFRSETRHKSRVWFLSEPVPRTGFDRSALSDWIDSNWLRTFDRRFPSMWLSVAIEGYQSGARLPDIPVQSDTVDVTWGAVLRMHGYEMPEQIVAGQDLANGFPPAGATAGEIIRYDHVATIPAGVPPGRYQVTMRLMRTVDGQTVAHGDGVDVRLPDVIVQASECKVDDSELLAAVLIDKKSGLKFC